MSPFCDHLILVRHGSTHLNEGGQVISDEDPPLSDLGINQVKRLQRWFFDQRYQDVAVISSNMSRAKETAKYLAEHFTIENSLRERNLGPFAGQSIEKIVATKKRLNLEVRDPTLVWEGIDSVESDCEIVSRVSGMLFERPFKKTVVCVSHAGVLKSLAYHFLSIPADTPYAIKFSLASALVFCRNLSGFELVEYWSNPLSRSRGTL